MLKNKFNSEFILVQVRNHNKKLWRSYSKEFPAYTSFTFGLKKIGKENCPGFVSVLLYYLLLFYWQEFYWFDKNFFIDKNFTAILLTRIFLVKTRTILVKLLILYRLKLLALSFFQNVKCGLIRLCKRITWRIYDESYALQYIVWNGYGPIQINVHLNFLLSLL